MKGAQNTCRGLGSMTVFTTTQRLNNCLMRRLVYG
nr:MAG TPA: hypothetical protein [Caudoviricetes sp.]